jgi:hypothetical protein
MKINELVKSMREEKPELFAGIRPGAASALIREAFGRVSQAIAETEDGVVKVGGMGAFRSVTLEREADGTSVKKRRVIFVPAAIREGTTRSSGGSAEG